MSEKVSWAERLDGWGSVVMGLGSALRDKVESFSFSGSARAWDNWTTNETAYQQDDIVAKIVDTFPTDATREGFKLGTGDTVTDKALGEDISKSGALEALKNSWKWSNLHGGGATWVIVDDGRRQDEPVNWANIRRIISFRDLTSFEVSPEKFYEDPMQSNWGKPQLFRLETTGLQVGFSTTTMIHESRLIKFRGVPPRRTDETSPGRHWWGVSMLERANEPMRWSNLIYKATAHLVSDSAQSVMKIKGLAAMINANQGEQVLKRLGIVDTGRSIARAIAIDAEGEDFTRQPLQLSGLHEILTKSDSRLASSVGLPVTKLFGTSPGGMNATGESDLQGHYGNVSGAQADKLKPALDELIRFFVADKSRPFGKVKTWTITFNPLKKLSGTEEADRRNKIANTDKIYVDMGAVLPEEISASRFGPEGFSEETTIDLTLRTDKPAETVQHEATTQNEVQNAKP